jgi:hypothetical protein
MSDYAAGREVDALVAEKVMDWAIVQQKYLDGTPAGPLIFDSDGQLRGGPGEGWSPSTNIPQAWEVVEKLPAPVNVYRHADGSYTVRVGSWSPTAGRPDPPTATAPTAPLAICRAALRAMEVA